MPIREQTFAGVVAALVPVGLVRVTRSGVARWRRWSEQEAAVIGRPAAFTHLRANGVRWIAVIGALALILFGAIAPAAASSRPVGSGGRNPAPVAQAHQANGCTEARAARDAALARLQVDYEQALADLRSLRDATARDAAAQNKDLSAETLDTIEEAARAELAARARAARSEIAAVADLHDCDGGDDDHGQIFDIADLRNRYNAIVDRALVDFKRTVAAAADRLAIALRDAPVRVPQASSQGSVSRGD